MSCARIFCDLARLLMALQAQRTTTAELSYLAMRASTACTTPASDRRVVFLAGGVADMTMLSPILLSSITMPVSLLSCTMLPMAHSAYLAMASSSPIEAQGCEMLRTRASQAPWEPSLVWLLGLLAAKSATTRTAHTITDPSLEKAGLAMTLGTHSQQPLAPRRLRLVMWLCARHAAARTASRTMARTLKCCSIMSAIKLDALPSLLWFSWFFQHSAEMHAQPQRATSGRSSMS